MDYRSRAGRRRGHDQHALMLGALTLVRERERGSWEAPLATPLSAIDALAGKLAPCILVGVLQPVLVIWVARLLIAMPLRRDLVALLVAVPVYSAAHLILGFAFSALAENQLQAVQSAGFSIFRPCCSRDSFSHFRECLDGLGRSARYYRLRISCVPLVASC